jgi:glutathione S-transferase
MSLVLYNAPRCPYVARVRIVLAEKGIDYEVVDVDLDDRPAWLYEKNPAGRVPVVEEDDGRPLPESAVIMEFLEERYPEPALLPPDPADRAAVRLLIFRDGDLTAPYYALRRGDEGAAEKLDAALRRFDGLLGEQPYLGGAEYGLADIALVPWFLRARDMLGVELDGLPALSDWLARLEQRPAIAAEAGIVAAL